MSLRQLLLTTFVVVFLGLIGYWSYNAENPNSIIQIQSIHSNEAPDFFVQNARIREFGPTGNLESTLDSDEISHFPHNDTTLLSQPDLWTFDEVNQPWHTVADNGRILPDGETVELIDNVVMIQIDPQGNPEQRIDTDFLTVYSGQDFAETDEPVRLTNPTSVVNSVGMRAFYKRDFIQLKSRVKSIHESR